MDEAWLYRMIMVFNTSLMMIHQIHISDALHDLRDVLAKKKLNKK